MYKTVVFTVTRYYENGLPVVSIETDNKNFSEYNVEKLSISKLFDRMENIAIMINKKNYAVFFEIG